MMDLPLYIQMLPLIDQVLAISYIAGLRSPSGWFRSTSVTGIFSALRLPRPSNSGTYLSRLSKKGLVTRHNSEATWSITPLGRQRVTELISDVSLEQLAPWVAAEQGAGFAGMVQPIVSQELAPASWVSMIAEFTQQFPFEQNIFCMTRFPSGEDGDPVSACIDELREAARCHGMSLHLASDRQIVDDVLGNVAAHMWACKFGVAVLEDRLGRGMNYNVIFEVGAMLMTGRRCALLKDISLPEMPTDVVGQIYKLVDLRDLATVSAEIHSWLANDLNLGKCVSCPNDA